MSSSMRNFMEAYAAVHNTEAKEELTSVRDEISEMNLSALTDTDLDEIVESVLEEMFQKGYSVDSAHTIFSEMFVESTIAGRQAKIDRLCESLNKAFDVIDSKASTIALEEFGKYRYNKRLQESWSARFNQEKRVQRTHGQLVAQESLNVKTLLLQLVEKADKSYLETDMKKRQENNEKARKDMEKMGSKMKNPHFEEVSQIRKGWGDAYASIYEKKLDPVGKEDGDVDNDGDEDSSDEYLMKRRKAIGKAMGKKKEKVEEGMKPYPAEKVARKREAVKKKEDIHIARGEYDKADTQYKRGVSLAMKTKMKKEEYEVTVADKKGNTKAYQNYKAGMKNVKTGKPLYKAGKGVEEEFEPWLDEAITSEKGKAKMKAMLDARTTASGRAKAGKGENVAQIKHIGRANVDGYGGTPPNLKVAKNPVKSRTFGGTGNKAARRAGTYQEDFDLMFDSLIEEGYSKSEALKIMTQMALDELYKGKHGQSEKEYADSRSEGGKMVSGTSKMSGAEYTHGRRVKASNPGMQPDVGGKTKPKSQGRMDRGARADLEYRKANLKAGK